MDEEKKFDTWLENILKRPIPQNPMLQIQTLAKEIAEGAIERHWKVQIEVDTSIPERYIPISQKLQAYLRKRWETSELAWGLLVNNKFLDGHGITEKAFNLLSESEPLSIFISYKRSESSAFAMYVLTRLKQENLEAFVDLSLIPGENWHAGLEERIKEYDYFIALLGKETLKSDICIKEIGWAIKAELRIIPVWHNEFEYKTSEWGIPEKIDHVLSTTHSIKVKEESASGYNTAMVELLNVFGITP